MQTIFVAWQQPSSREWIPVGRLDRYRGEFRFMYTRGAKRAENFRPFGRMDNLHGTYYSSVLFPLFANRVLTRSRPEFSRYFDWTGLPDYSIDDPLPILAVTGGLRGTDPIELFALPQRDTSGRFAIDFFARGMSHFAPPNVEAANALKPGSKLFVMRDLQNEHDQYALCLRTNDPSYLVGYCPKYYTQDICKLLALNPKGLTVTVKQVNVGAPLTMRLLCALDAPWHEGFEPFSENEDMQSLATLDGQ
ncbi:HIRAN domain-containing protein [Paraburkholderia sp. SUR17]|uniref:HIRAN domain-containing protein n=1 Tax=Paraburkholderia sp. SUR17 TaxID=3034358 RepID=UPI002407B298|nr:HIRAN domain-containing protein [Paraburkholderia sp. SUR17]WEY38821.1 HIRAN domain-containing protein [Paraburkholderia sp. SUR17]